MVVLVTVPLFNAAQGAVMTWAGMSTGNKELRSCTSAPWPCHCTAGGPWARLMGAGEPSAPEPCSLHPPQHLPSLSVHFSQVLL